MNLRDLFKSREERQKERENETREALSYLESIRKKAEMPLIKNVVTGSIQAIEDGEDPGKAKRRIDRYLERVEEAERRGEASYAITKPYHKIRAMPEERILQEKQARLQRRTKRADDLYAQWNKSMRVSLKEALVRDPNVLTNIWFSTLNKEPHGGSFYAFPSTENLVKKRPDGRYLIEIYPGSREMGLSSTDDNKGKGYSTEEIADRVASGLLDVTRYGATDYSGGKTRRIPGRIYALDTIKRITGIDLRGKPKSSGLEKTLSVSTILSILSGIFFLSPRLTGNAIANISQSSSNILGAVLLVVGLIGGFFYLKRKLGN